MIADAVMTTFSSDYFTARTRFREAVERLGWMWRPYRIACPGPRGEELTIDVATSSPPDAECVLVISSGLHGIEGFFGSAVQLALLKQWTRQGGSPSDLRFVFLHALEPSGFAWLRRFDSDNVDLNRNFLLDHIEYHGGSDRYADFDGLLNPQRPPSRLDLFHLKALSLIARHGTPALKQTIVAGQHDFPKGLFFGGRQPSPTTEILQEHMKSWIGDSATVVHLDFHTGLGVWGKHKLLIDYRLSPAQQDRLTRWFGTEAWEENASQRVAYQLQGSFGAWCTARDLAAEYLFAFAEFGTYSNIRVIAALRAENQAHHWGKPKDASTRRAKQRLMEVFCPASTTWRRRVLEQGCRLVEKAISGMKSGAGFTGTLPSV